MRLHYFALPILAASSTAAARQAQEPLQVYLHPTPSDSSSYKAAPTLTAEQAKAVLSHHLGEAIGDFEEIPSDEGLWSHLMHMWGGNHRESSGGGRTKAKVVIVEGGVMPQGELGDARLLCS